MVFPDKEDSIWELDDRTGEWYLHNFYKHQPDLNLANPAVVDEILRIVGFWLELGFDGFRVDGIPFLEQNAQERRRPHRHGRPARADEDDPGVPQPARRSVDDAG